MQFTKRELVYQPDKLISWRIGYSLCSVYKKNVKNSHAIELWNFGYCPADQGFYYTKNLHLPKDIINYFNGAEYNEKNIAKMEELGIYNGQTLDQLIKRYEKTKEEVLYEIQLEIEKPHKLNFQKQKKK